MPLRNLPSAMEGRTVAQISDIHVSPHVDADYLRSAMRELSVLQPDMVCITGDFMSGGSAPEGVEHESVTLDDDEAAAIERWCEEIAMRAKRTENAEKIENAVS